MDEISDDVFEQIEEFDHDDLTEEQESLIDKLIIDEELKERYKENGLCENCKQPNTGYNWCRECSWLCKNCNWRNTEYDWCQPCIINNFQSNFKHWTSRNHDVDEFIQKA